jgi:hypothetical protein
MEKTDFNIDVESLKDLVKNIKIDDFKFQKMLLFYNCIEDGWTIKKNNNSFVFSKKHEGKKQILDDSYLIKFMKTNLDINRIIN